MEMHYIALFLVATGLSTVPARTNADFDYFLFVQEWPQTVCQMAAVNEVCKIPSNCTGWGIHGIWPTKDGEEGPNYCNKSAYFSWEAIDSLTAELMQYWPNCYISTPFWSFWEHEYLKHGTCCTGITSMVTEYGFFSTTIDLFRKHQIDSVLESGNIYPSNTTAYRASDISDKIQAGTGVKPLLYCYYDKYAKDGMKQMLQQIVLCMDKSFSLIDCPAEAHASCYTDEPVIYPERATT